MTLSPPRLRLVQGAAASDSLDAELVAGADGGAAVHLAPVLPAGEGVLAVLPVVSLPLDLATLFRDYSRFVAQVVLRVLGRDHEVDDVVQEVFLTAMKGMSAIQNPQAIRGWLKTIAVRKSFRHLRKRRVRTLLGFDRGACYDHVAASGCGPEDKALLSRVYGLLDELPTSERLAWTLRYVEGEQVDVVARLCGCSLATAKRRITAAQEHIERKTNHGC